MRKVNKNTFAIHTLGCKANSYDSECIKASFISSNYIEKNFNNNDLGVYIINTCAVTNRSENKSRKYIRNVRKRSPNSLIAVVGCYSQIKSKEIKDSLDVDIILGTENKDKIPNIIRENNKLKITPVTFSKKHEDNITISNYTNQTRAFVKIQDGCNNFCTFCIIPYTRGRMRSRKPNIIVNEIQNLVNSGHKEVVLTGIHTAGYAEDMNDFTFTKLLRLILKEVPNLQRLRISSIEASQVSEDFLKLLKNNKRLMPHLHIPIQSGSDKILLNMERMYNKNHYFHIIQKIKNTVPNIAITTDAIVGFPGETQKNFEEAISFYKEIEYSEMHIFPYSKKDGTPAAKMEQVNDFIKKMRVLKCLELNKIMALNYINKNIEKKLMVLFETKSDDDFYEGYSENYIRIKCFSKNNIKNKILAVKILKSNYPVSIGELIYE